MTMLSKPIADREIDQEFEFPNTGAKLCRILNNGHIVNYLDNRNEPASIFIEKRLWDNALIEFENTVEYSMIISHVPAKMEADL